jgi:hypothetical protein
MSTTTDAAATNTSMNTTNTTNPNKTETTGPVDATTTTRGGAGTSDSNTSSSSAARGGGPAGGNAGSGGVSEESVLAQWFSKLADRVQEGALVLKDSSVIMAKQIAIRINQIAGNMSGKCVLQVGDDATHMQMPRDHKLLLDELRRNRTAAYQLMLDNAKRFSKLKTNDQAVMLTTELPLLLQALQQV